MSLVSLPSFFSWPIGYEGMIGSFAYDNFTLDAASEKAAYIFQAPKDGDIRFLSYMLGPVTTGTTLLIRLETVGADGFPTGTLAGVNSETTDTVVVGDSNTWRKKQMTADYTATKGELLALVIANPAASFGNLAINRQNNWVAHSSYAAQAVPTYAKLNVGGVFAIGYSDGTYATIPNAWPSQSIAAANFNSGSTPDEKGNIFITPFKMTIAGIWAVISGNAGATGEYRLYDSVSAVLASKVFNMNQKLGTSTTKGFLPVIFSSPVTVDANQILRVSVLPDATNISLPEYTVAEGALMDATGADGQLSKTERTNAGVWSNTGGAMCLMGVLISEIDDGTGGGGGGGGMMGNIGKRCLFPGFPLIKQ